MSTTECFNEGCGGGCGCKSCPRAKGRKAAVMTMGYSEQAADALVFGQMAPIGYPTPNFGPEVEEAIKNSKVNNKNKAVANFSEDVEADMAMARIDVMRGRLDELAMKLGTLSEVGEVEIDVWMHDKLTLAADYISAVADAALYGGGIEVEREIDERMYAEKKGLWANIHQKRKRIKAGSGERMKKPGEKGAPSAKDLKDSQTDDKKFGEGKRPDYPDVDKDGDRKESMESAIRNAKAKKARAKKAGIKIS